MNGNSTPGLDDASLTVQKDPITDEIFGYLAITFKLVLSPALGAMAVCGNVINMAVFYKMGLSEGVTQNFFILSVWDFLIGAAAEVNSAAYVFQTYVYRGEGGSAETGSQVLHWATMLATTFPQNFSLVTTVVIAVVRCCCVAMPLRVKYLITARRQLAAIFFFCGGATVVLIFVIAPAKIVLVNDPLTNSSLAIFSNLNWYTYTLFTGMFFYTGFFIVIICVIILSISLYRSSSFREKSTSVSCSSDSQVKDGRRETRIVKTVVFVSIVFIVCYVPAIVFSVLGELVEEYSAFGVYRNSNSVTIMIMGASLLVNADVNILIYFFSNVRYRKIFITMFSSSKRK